VKNLIRKILKEETEDFDWTKEIDPLLKIIFMVITK
jgi:hypothetical protein